MRRENLSWILASESSVICISQWPGGRHSARDKWTGDDCHPSYKHHREQLVDFFQTMSIWRKPIFCYIDFSTCESSAFCSPLGGRAWMGPILKLWGTRKPECPSSALLLLLILRFLKRRRRKPLVPDWTSKSFKFCSQAQNSAAAKNVNTDHSRWRANGQIKHISFACSLGCFSSVKGRGWEQGSELQPG